MRLACVTETIASEPRCGGQVRIKPEHLDAAQGGTDEERRGDMLAEAGIGCCQGCGCLSASAEFVRSTDATGRAVEDVVARCGRDPSALALGGRIEPDPVEPQ